MFYQLDVVIIYLIIWNITKLPYLNDTLMKMALELSKFVCNTYAITKIHNNLIYNVAM